MSDVALFELEAPTWEPVYLPKYSWAGTALDATAEQWKAHHKQYRCRDCGELMSKLKHVRGCGGGDRGGGYEVCDDCAALDYHWGVDAGDDRDRLVQLQARRRAKYLRGRARLAEVERAGGRAAVG